MGEQLQEMYQKLLHNYGYAEQNNMHNINQMIKEFISEFIHNCKIPAIWCYGEHTKMLMSDFIYVMKQVQYVIDAKFAGENESGFKVISEKEIRENYIDGIIISSFFYKDEIKEKIKSDFPEIKYLDIYEMLEVSGVELNGEYYSQSHPYRHYIKINNLKNRLRQNISAEEKRKLFEALIEEYLMIKDFRTAITCIKDDIASNDSMERRGLLEDLESIYKLELEYASKISENHIMMLCIDGLRRRDLLNGRMPKMKKFIDQNTMFFQNAYSVSTSTYESLIPAYSENSDLRTKYYQTNLIPEKQCRFIQEAISQKREIYFYTDSTCYVDSKHINITDQSQTASEKIWDFILHAVNQDNGLSYVHILYESHFSYPNPYTNETLIADGASIMFDFLSKNGSRIRTDYNRQHKDALQYLDDILYPFVELFKCRMVIYADHGNIILDQGMMLEHIEKSKLSFHEELIQVPLIVKSPETGIGIRNDLCSIMDLNQIIIDLMNKEKVIITSKHHIKAVRSEIYNPDFKHIYHKCDYAQGLLAFEVFLFHSGYKFVVFSDGCKELYKIETDEKIEDFEMSVYFWNQIKNEITVTESLIALSPSYDWKDK